MRGWQEPQQRQQQQQQQQQQQGLSRTGKNNCNTSIDNINTLIKHRANAILI